VTAPTGELKVRQLDWLKDDLCTGTCTHALQKGFSGGRHITAEIRQIGIQGINNGFIENIMDQHKQNY
jgi:hypothetical protein